MESQVALESVATGRLSERVRHALVNAIVDGAFEDLLPSEHELARQLGVSRTTVRGALRSIEDEGLVTRLQGEGTRVNGHIVRARLTLNRVAGFWDLIAEAGHEPAIAFTDTHTRTAGLEAAARLGCSPEESVVVIDRLFLASGEPAVLLTEMIEQKNLRSAVDATSVSTSIFEFASEQAVAPIDHTVVDIIPVVSDSKLSKSLAVESGSPLLRLIETHYTRTNQPLILSTIHVVDRFLRFNVVRRRG